jgi:hypothetical protein
VRRLFVHTSILACAGLALFALALATRSPWVFHGTLHHPVVALGGETTGTEIDAGGTFYELDLRRLGSLSRETLCSLNGTRIRVEGSLVIQPGIDVAERRIIQVNRLEMEVE